MHSVFQATILRAIHRHEATRLQRRSLSHRDPVEAVDCRFKLVRTGMQWRELQPKTASHLSLSLSLSLYTLYFVMEGLIPNEEEV